MKKILSTLTALSILGTAAPVMAAPMAVSASASASSGLTDQEAMKTALAAVKSRIDIPAECTEFESSVQNYKNVTEYSFHWYSKDDSEWLNVSCDAAGRISSFDHYRTSDRPSDPRLPDFTRAQAADMALAFLAKAAPETLSDENDRLVLQEKRDYYSSSTYHFRLNRARNGIDVANDYANISIDMIDGNPAVVSADINYTYDAQFEEASQELADPAAAYRAVYPEELVYSKDNEPILYKSINTDKAENDTKLIYRIKDNSPGYISAYTGEKVTATYEYPRYANASAEDAAMATNKASGGFTRQELAELDNIAGLYSTEDAEKFLRSIPQIALDKDMTISDSSVFCTDKDKKEYNLRLNFTNETAESSTSVSPYRSMNVTFDAKRSRLTNLYSYGAYKGDPEDKVWTQEDLAKANTGIDSFLDTVARDTLNEYKDITEASENEEISQYLSRSYRRVVNNIPYINDTIYVSYDMDTDQINRYSLYYSNDAAFDDPSTAISSDNAYARLLEEAPLKKQYVNSDGTYHLVYSMTGSPMINAFTGEDSAPDSVYEPAPTFYTDLDGHWCYEPVRALYDYGIALSGSEFRPDEPITQADLLRLFCCGTTNRYSITYPNDTVYVICQNNDILTEEERSDDAAVTRELAFIYMVRFAGAERIAKLPDIFKVTYADGDKLTDCNIGYAAILSGMGVICGSGGMIRPQENITRAEAAQMLYNYMK